jgi:hypothetical protein
LTGSSHSRIAKGLAAQNIGGSHAVDGRKHRLHHARQIVRDRRSRQLFAGEAEIHHGRGLAGGLGHDRIVRFLRDQIFDRVHLGEHFGQRLVRIEIQLDVDLDRAGALHRRRGHVVDALGGGDRLLDRRGDEALDQVGRRAGIDGGDVDHRVRQFRILPDRQAGRGPKPISRISRLTTTDSTGRLMKISVQTIAMRSARHRQ